MMGPNTPKNQTTGVVGGSGTAMSVLGLVGGMRAVQDPGAKAPCGSTKGSP